MDGPSVMLEAIQHSVTRRASLEAIGDPALGQIIGRQFNQHIVSSQHTDAVLAHLASGMTKDFMIIFEFHAEHRVGQQFDDRAAHFEKFFLGHKVLVTIPSKTARPYRANDKKERRRVGAQAVWMRRVRPAASPSIFRCPTGPYLA